MGFIKRLLAIFGFIKEINSISIPSSTVKNEDVVQEKSAEVDIVPLIENATDTTENQYTQPQFYPAYFRAKKIAVVGQVEEVERIEKGVLEDFFFDHLSPRQKTTLKNNLRIILPEGKLTPDLVYINETTSVCIAIEIDEPYSLNNKGEPNPTHYKGVDDLRNKWLLKNGWNVLRFSEEQIARHPKDCEDCILDFIDGIESHVLAKHSCWSYEDAQAMIAAKFRNTYLPFGFSEQIKRNYNSSYRHFDCSTIRGITTIDKGEDKVVIELELNKERLGPGEYRYDSKACYIPEEIFWNRAKELNIDSKLRSKMAKLQDCRYQIYISDMAFEGYGQITDLAFRLSDNEKFILSMPESRVKRKPQKLTKDEINALRIMGLNINDEGNGLK